MSGLKENTNEKVTYVGIKEGKLVVKQLDKTLKEYKAIEGIIRKVVFNQEEYEGNTITQTSLF